MKLVSKKSGQYEMIETRDYNPTPEELHYWYGSTSTLDPDNPYAPNRSRVTRTTFKLTPTPRKEEA
jgi:hypothetical protein